VAVTFRSDAHLYPLYLKLAVDNFRKANTTEAMIIFGAACHKPKELEFKVYRQMWKLKGRPEGDPEFGKKCFRNQKGLSSSALEKAEAINRVLRKLDQNELTRREYQVHKCLWLLKGEPRGDLEYGKHAIDDSYGKSSCVEEKLAAARMYANESRPFTWFTDNQAVHLIKRADGELETFVVDKHSEKSKVMPLDREGMPVEQIIPLLKEYIVTVNGDEIIPSRPLVPNNFGFPFHTDPGKEVRLRLKEGALIWQEFDSAKRVSSWVHVNSSDIQVVSNLTHLSNEEYVAALGDFTMEAATDPSSGKLISVNLAKVSFSSKMDPSKIVDKDNWAITLVSHGASLVFNDRSIDPGFGHAKIIYEGAEDGTHFIRQIHLTTMENRDIEIPPGHARVEVKEFTIDPSEIKARTQTWLRPRSTVQRLEGEANKFYLFNHSGNGHIAASLYGYNAGYEVGKQVNSLWDLFSKITEGINQILPEMDAKLAAGEVLAPNCLNWAINAMGMAGVKLPCANKWLAVPDDYLRHIAADSSLI
jgi:hypothetical protein